jgi:hypothetical protein
MRFLQISLRTSSDLTGYGFVLFLIAVIASQAALSAESAAFFVLPCFHGLWCQGNIDSCVSHRRICAAKQQNRLF